MPKTKNWYERNGEIEWKSKDGSLWVEIQCSRRFLMAQGIPNRIAEQISPSGDVEVWVRKKIKEREKSTREWVKKLESQLEDAKAQHAAWQKHQNSI